MSEHDSESVPESGEREGPGGKQHSRWGTIRRRVAPLAFLVALVVLATRTCSSEIASVELVLDFGVAAERVRQVRVDMFPRGEDRSVLVFEKRYGQGGVTTPPRLEAQLDPGMYEVLFEVGLDNGVHRLERSVEVTDQAVITMNLERDLR